ncbi:hypothetical protein [Intestinibacter sp.]
MSTFVFEYKIDEKNIDKYLVAGENKKKDASVKLSKVTDNKMVVTINSEVNTDKDLWKDIIDRFILINGINANILIEDGGAKPGTILFRLNEAIEQL